MTTFARGQKVLLFTENGQGRVRKGQKGVDIGQFISKITISTEMSYINCKLIEWGTVRATYSTESNNFTKKKTIIGCSAYFWQYEDFEWKMITINLPVCLYIFPFPWKFFLGFLGRNSKFSVNNLTKNCYFHGKRKEKIGKLANLMVFICWTSASLW